MDEKKLVNMATFVTETANAVKQMDSATIQVHISQLHDIREQLGCTDNVYDLKMISLMDRLHTAADRCINVCLDRLQYLN